MEYIHFYAACEEGNISEVMEFIEGGFDINGREEDGIYPLNISIVNNHYQLFVGFLEKGANPNRIEGGGKSVLVYALEEGDIKYIRRLLEKGADTERTFLDRQIHEHITPLIYACRIGNLEIIRELLNHGADVNKCDDDGYTPLFYACIRQNINIVRELLNRGANIEHKNNDGNTVLNHICDNFYGEIEDEMEDDIFPCFLELLNRGANIFTTDEEGWTPILNACRTGNYEMTMELLNRGADINVENRISPLICATLSENYDLVLELLERGANPFYRDDEGEDFLDRICYSEERERFQDYVENMACDVKPVKKS